MYYGKRKKRADRTKRKEDKSMRRFKRKKGGTDGAFTCANQGSEKNNIKEDALEFMKNMNKQELVDFLLSNDDWHVKTSGINASGI